MPSAPDPARISVEAVGKSFSDGAGRLQVIEEIGLTVASHEFVSLLGPSGCGKSTLLGIIAGLDQPSTGEVEVDGHADRLGRSGLMPQRDLLMPWKRVADNVALGPIVNGVPRPQARRRAEEILERFGLGEFTDHYPAQLSGGMRQRAALARTFLSGDDILLLDEPFGALDSLTRLQMHTWLLDVWQGSAASVLFVTHDVEEAILLSDRVYVLSARPSRVAAVFAVNLPRPRTPHTALTPDFVDLKREALSYLHPEAGPLR